MSDEEFIQEAQDLIKRVVEAETTNFLEIAEIADINPEYRHEIEGIEQSYIACKQASEWLSNHRTELVAEARRLIGDNQLEIEDFNKVEVSLEQVEKFCKSINIYLLWIENYITDGVVPTPLPKEIMTLVLPTEYYLKVLEAIKDHNISTENGLSSQAVYELRGYFKRFLIQGLKKYS
ncbi:MAG: hypothetical protein F6K58_28530 [Symploca sp. SIO2E9]|nr:hypothetical protein [Symploca sp. SIO2E9]